MNFIYFIYSFLPPNMRRRLLSQIWSFNPNFQLPEPQNKIALIGAMLIPDLKEGETPEEYVKRLKLSLLSNFLGRSVSSIVNRVKKLFSHLGVRGSPNALSSLLGEDPVEQGEPAATPASKSNLKYGFSLINQNIFFRLVKFWSLSIGRPYSGCLHPWHRGRFFHCIKSFSIRNIMGRIWEKPLTISELSTLSDDELIFHWLTACNIGSNLDQSLFNLRESALLLYSMSPRPLKGKAEQGLTGYWTNVDNSAFIDFLHVLRNRKILTPELIELWPMKKTLSITSELLTSDTAWQRFLTFTRNFWTAESIYTVKLKDAGDMFENILKSYFSSNLDPNEEQIPCFHELPSIWKTLDDDNSDVVIGYDLKQLLKLPESLALDIIARSKNLTSEVLSQTQTIEMSSEFSTKDVDFVNSNSEMARKYEMVYHYLHNVLSDPANVKLLNPDLLEQGAFSLTKALSKVKKLMDNPIVKGALTVIPYGSAITAVVNAADKNKDVLKIVDKVISKGDAKKKQTSKKATASDDAITALAGLKDIAVEVVEAEVKDTQSIPEQVSEIDETDLDSSESTQLGSEDDDQT